MFENSHRQNKSHVDDKEINAKAFSRRIRGASESAHFIRMFSFFFFSNGKSVFAPPWKWMKKYS